MGEVVRVWMRETAAASARKVGRELPGVGRKGEICRSS